MLYLEFGSTRFSDNYRKQFFLSLGSDDIADLEPWCSAIIVEIPAILSTISIDDRKFFEILLVRAKRPKKKYTPRVAESIRQQFNAVHGIRSIRPIDLQLALTQPEGIKLGCLVIARSALTSWHYCTHPL